MRIVHIIFFVLLIVSVSSCYEDDEMYLKKEPIFYAATDFKQGKKLVHKKWTSISDSLVFPSDMELVNNRIVLMDHKSPNPIHIIDIENKKYIGSHGKRGQDMGEIHVPWGLSKITKKSFIVYDFLAKKIVGFDIDSVLRTGKSMFEYKINEKGYCSSVLMVDKNVYYTDYLSATSRIFKQNVISKEIKGYGYLLDNSGKAQDHVFAQACRSIISNNNNKFVVAYKFAPYFEIYNEANDSWVNILAVDNFQPIFRESLRGGHKEFSITKNTRLGFIDVSLTNKFIYLLYSGEKKLDHRTEKANIVLAFDYQGNPKKRYELDTYISSFEIVNDSVMYGIKNDIRADFLQFNLTQKN